MLKRFEKRFRKEKRVWSENVFAISLAKRWNVSKKKTTQNAFRKTLLCTVFVDQKKKKEKKKKKKRRYHCI